MRPAWLQLDARALRSRVARRIFTVFCMCSLLPVGLFALFSYTHVRAQLEQDATANLRNASKVAGMSILERLMIAEQALSVLVQQHQRELGSGPVLLPVDDGRILEIAALPAEAVEARLPAAERVALAGGRVLLRTVAQSPPPARIELLRRLDARRPDSPLVAAVLDPAFVFEPRRRSQQDLYRVEDEQGHLLFSASAPADEARPRARTAEPGIEASWELFLRSRFHAPSWKVSFARPVREVHRPLLRFEAIFPLVALAALGAAVGLSLSQVRRTLVPIETLALAARRISTGELDVRVETGSRDEFAELGRAFNEMTEELRRQNRVLMVINEVGAALSAEQDTTRLLDLILRGATRVTDAIGGALFLSTDGAPPTLTRVWLEPGSEVPDAADVPLDPIVARRCFEQRKPLVLDPLEALGTAEETRSWAAFEAAIQMPLGPRLAVPMRNGSEEVVGVLVLFRRAADGGSFPTASRRLAQSLASQAAIAIAKNQLVDGYRELFEGVIQMTVRAIDEKSPHTGDHCRNVPILTELIADAVCAADRGPLKQFDLSDEERYELRIAALLHDCGKVVTPVHVMDKATKLQTLFDRIELVDLRFELLRRDLVREVPQGQQAARLRQLEDDRAFLRRCNRGVEDMPEADRRRVRTIADRYRFTCSDGVERPLLDDQEVENLTIRRGTLNDTERAIIEQHVVSTIDLLSELPFPRALAAVPQIAGAHHERTDGSGYPHGLGRDDITMQGRILGLADVFEALTARDRPYKPGRTLSETLEILRSMRDAGALDPDIHDLFVTEKVYLRYAAEHLAPEQIDAAHQDDLERLTAGF